MRSLLGSVFFFLAALAPVPAGAALEFVSGATAFLASNPTLARSIRNRFPYLDPLNHLQLELLKRHRAGDAQPRVRNGIHLSINGLAAGLRNSG